MILPIRLRLLAGMFALAVGLVGLRAQSSDTTTPVVSEDAYSSLRELVEAIQGRLREGANTPAALAPELARFDALIEKERKDRPEVAALALLTKVSLYIQVFQDGEAARRFVKQLAEEFPQTEAGKDALRVAAQMEAQDRSSAIQSGLIGRPAPELAFTWTDRPGGLKSLADLKGKVVVLDFWATWCGPCLSSFPQVAELVKHYADAPVEVIGVTSLQGRVMNLEAQPIDTRNNPAKEYELMPAFAKKHGVTWSVAFSEQPVFNPDYGITGIPYMAIIAPDGTVRHAGLHPAMPHEEKVAMIDAILTEYGLKK